MIIDLVYGILLVLAIFKGFSRGLIVGLFSFVAVMIGLAAAIKLSALVAGYIGDSVKVSQQWLPVISFLVVFIGVVLLVRLGANAIQKTVELAMLGWLNRLGGIILYVAIYTIVFSIALFYAVQVNIIRQETIDASLSYSSIAPWGPRAIDAFGVVIPWFRDMFGQLQDFFGGVSEAAPKAGT